jgi:aspartyl-tRNA(Asn)/glutamyl-tRNA(Gln) amidotransferase subunit C
MAGTTITTDDVKKIAVLAKLPITDAQAHELTTQLGSTVSYVSQLSALSTDDVVETSQVTGLENVYREDIVDTERMFTQDEALQNAPKTHNGYFLVDAIFSEQ